MSASTFDWNGYLVLAQELAGRSDEASLRTAISRAYYAVFHKVCSLIDIDPSRVEGSHFKVWEQVRARRDRVSIRIATEGHELRRLRGRADYSSVVSDLERLAAFSVQSARELIRLAEEKLR